MELSLITHPAEGPLNGQLGIAGSLGAIIDWLAPFAVLHKVSIQRLVSWQQKTYQSDTNQTTLFLLKFLTVEANNLSM